MNNQTQSRLASVLLVVVGGWIILSPLFIEVTGSALVNTLAIGGVMALAGFVELFWRNTLPSWLSAVAALWAFVSIYAFDMSNAAAWNIALSAGVAFVLSVWDGVEISQLEQSDQGRQVRI